MNDLVWSLEERPNVDVEPEVGETCSDHLRSTIVTVLSHLGNLKKNKSYMLIFSSS